MATETIEIQEVTRKLAAGRFTYATYNGRTFRRAAKRGRPHYEAVAALNLGNGDKPAKKTINVSSQLAKLFLAK